MADLGGPSTPESGGAKGQDRFLPIANIGRVMRKAIPDNGKIAKEAKESVQECVSEFISFITSEACVKCQREKRKTINGDDLLWAMGTLGFEAYVDPLKLYLSIYREMEGDPKGTRSIGQSGKREGAFNGDSGSSSLSRYAKSHGAQEPRAPARASPRSIRCSDAKKNKKEVLQSLVAK